MTNVATRFQPDISGSAVPTGFIGEKITWASAPSSQNFTTEADWTNASIVLTSGIWQVFASISCLYFTGNTSGDSGRLTVKITDSSNTVVQEMEKSIGIKTAGNVDVSTTGVLTFNFIANLNSSTTYKIRAVKTDSTGTGFSTVYNQASFRSQFYAVRIA